MNLRAKNTKKKKLFLKKPIVQYSIRHWFLNRREPCKIYAKKILMAASIGFAVFVMDIDK